MTPPPATDTIATDLTTSAKGRRHPARRAGQIVQGLVLGLGLPLALAELIRIAGEIAPFKYQGF